MTQSVEADGESEQQRQPFQRYWPLLRPMLSLSLGIILAAQHIQQSKQLQKSSSVISLKSGLISGLGLNEPMKGDRKTIGLWY
jgi:hypothetical protein